eukprot:1244000-Pleurochrysis_carterae.AAC.3
MADGEEEIEEEALPKVFLGARSHAPLTISVCVSTRLGASRTHSTPRTSSGSPSACLQDLVSPPAALLAPFSPPRSSTPLS